MSKQAKIKCEKDYIADAVRYRRLAKLIESGEWVVSRESDNPLNGYLEEMEDKEDMDFYLDEVEINLMDNIDIALIYE